MWDTHPVQNLSNPYGVTPEFEEICQNNEIAIYISMLPEPHFRHDVMKTNVLAFLPEPLILMILLSFSRNELTILGYIL